VVAQVVLALQQQMELVVVQEDLELALHLV
jgi:hypothetical protein